MPAPDLLPKLGRAEPWNLRIDNDASRSLHAHRSQRLDSIANDHDVESLALERRLERMDQVRIVFNDENLRRDVFVVARRNTLPDTVRWTSNYSSVPAHGPSLDPAYPRVTASQRLARSDIPKSNVDKTSAN